MLSSEKATIYLKGDKPPVIVDGFKGVYVHSSSQEEPQRIVPERLFVYPDKAYTFVGENSSLSVVGIELQAVHFEK